MVTKFYMMFRYRKPLWCLIVTITKPSSWIINVEIMIRVIMIGLISVAKVRHFKTKRASMYPGIWINYGPGLTLKEDANWRNWRRYNGIGFKISHHLFWLIVRGNF